MGSLFLDSTITTTYSETGSNGLKEKLAFTYARATHQQMTGKTHTDSKNQLWTTSYRYPHELASSSSVYQEMVDRHLFTPVLEEENRVGGVFTQLVKTNYKKWFPSSLYGGVSGFFAPVAVEIQEAGGTLIPQIVFGEKLSAPTENGYDAKAHPVVYTERNGSVTRLSWWQEHGKHDLVKGQTVNGTFTTTYDYHPLVGVKSMADPEGKVTYYEYDTFNRLKNIRNDNALGSIRASYCYNYAGQAISCTAISNTSGIVTPSSLLLLADILSNPLPVTLVDFVAIKEGPSALLTWKTSAEDNSDHFDVERSQDGKIWNWTGSVVAQGKSNTPGKPVLRYYSFRDLAPYQGPNLYRLKIVDSDGTFAYSRIEELSFEKEMVVYPNPLLTGDRLQLTPLDPNTIREVKIYDMFGKVMYTGRPSENGIDVSQLSTGSYLVQITGANGAVSTHRISKQ